jgi:hypothetical protein
MTEGARDFSQRLGAAMARGWIRQRDDRDFFLI